MTPSEDHYKGLTPHAATGFNALRAVKAGHVYPVDGTPWTSGTGPLGVEAILHDLDTAFR